MKHLQVEIIPNQGQPAHWDSVVIDPTTSSDPATTPWLRTLGDIGADGYTLVAVTPIGDRLYAFFAGEGDAEPLD
jgi:hypothetical protein